MFKQDALRPEQVQRGSARLSGGPERASYETGTEERGLFAMAKHS